ncbi:MAG: HigA family addiction module antidote protein [Burkholderiales bacterium]|nr:HigA family addiction module antidote protein [Burkholderiales bacterium]
MRVDHAEVELAGDQEDDRADRRYPREAASAAETLGVASSTLSRVLNGSSRVTPEMALRLSKAIGRSPESWLAMQDAHDLWIARERVDLQQVGKLKLAAV